MASVGLTEVSRTGVAALKGVLEAHNIMNEFRF